MPVKGGVALTNGFEFVVEVNHDLAKRHIKEQLHPISGDILLLHQFATLA